MYQNRATLIGFLGKDAEVRTTRNDTSFVVLSLATQRVWKDRTTGARCAETTWHRCVVWGKLTAFAGTLLKGAHLHVEGEIRTREYMANADSKKFDRAKRSITEIRVFAINRLDRRAKAHDSEHGEAAA